MRRFLDRLYLAAGAVAALNVMAVFVLMIAQAVMRQLGLRTGAVNDVVAWCCAAAAFMAMAHAFKHGDFVRVTLALDHVSASTRRKLEVFALGLGTAATAYVAYWANRFTYESWEFNDISTGLLPMPLWIPQASFALGSILLLIAVLDEFIIVLRGGVPTYVAALEARHAAGDYSSDI
jgi:TRAP-type C4-dicarboxylate transport system permease small subunit